MKQFQCIGKWWKEETKKTQCDIILKRFIYSVVVFKSIPLNERTNFEHRSINSISLIMFASARIHLIEWQTLVRKWQKKAFMRLWTWHVLRCLVWICSRHRLLLIKWIGMFIAKMLHSSHFYSNNHNLFMMSNNDVFICIFLFPIRKKKLIGIRIWCKLQDVMLSMTYNPANIFVSTSTIRN